ncbi:MAG TPA: di-heme oxidoredictase family protein, partial [Polyangiaceae bacterium]|nr:di-heme oxidoredictase family protein [Polyangiaceae bacterium]
APLIGLRFDRTFLHDGRASSVADAVSQHQGDGSEANAVIADFNALMPDEQQELIDFVTSL